jgi:hypothetical protein
MALSIDELKAAIIEKATKSPKPQLYIKDFYKCDPEAKPRADQEHCQRNGSRRDPDVLVLWFDHHVRNTITHQG